MEGTIGEIRLFAGNFAPRTWAFCDGQLLAIASNTALFSILGTTYGGDGRTTFGLPDLRGRVAIGVGNGPGLPSVRDGEKGGTDSTTLTILNMPSHNHVAQVDIKVTSDDGNSDEPAGILATTGGANIYGPGPGDGSYGGGPTSVTVGNSGGSQPFNNMQPYLGLRYIICLQGIFPSRS